MRTVELTAGGYTAWILPARGGSCIRLARLGAEALRTPKDLRTYREENPYLYGTPPLFPPNRISGGSFLFEGRRYRLPVNEAKTGCFLHGVLHETAFDVMSMNQCNVRLAYRATMEQPYLTFPHAFAVEMTYALDGEGLAQRVVFRNDSAENMPVALAFHTTFRIPFAQGGAPESVRLNLDTREEFSRDPYFLPDGGVCLDSPLRQGLEGEGVTPCRHTISRLYRMGDRHEMTLTDLKQHLRIRYRAGKTYGFWMVYNGGSPDFLCVEPQSWLSNAPNAPFPREAIGFNFLKPGETRAYETMLSIEPC